MRMTRLFSKTLREDPAEAETDSHRLMLKSGMIKQIASGLYCYLPLAWRALRKIEQIIRTEIDAAGAQEIRMPALHPLDIWNRTGRVDSMGETLFKLKDRRDRDLVLAPTHEEVFSMMISELVQSYRDLPKIIYQIQTKFRDEARPRGGLLRVREFDMKDAYSFDSNEAGLDVSYQAMANAYSNIYKKCGLPAIQAEADSGAIGGKDSHEFVLPSNSGEDLLIICDKCGYAANAERAESVKPKNSEEPSLDLHEILTPGVKTIEELASFLKISASKTLKTLVYSADGQMTLVTIRGDLEVNELKLKNLLGCKELRMASDEEVQASALTAGYLSIVGIKGMPTISDDSINLGTNFVVGANKINSHLANANYPRDLKPDVVSDISMAKEGDGCKKCGGRLSSSKGIEVGHIFKLGTFYTDEFNATYLDSEGTLQPIVMGCYGIGVGRLLAACIEHNHDERGIVFPSAITPYQIQLVALNIENPDVRKVADSLYHDFLKTNLEVLYDDREETAGVKFNDADLLGFPIRIVISPRNVDQNKAELKLRSEKQSRLINIGEMLSVVERINNMDFQPI